MYMLIFQFIGCPGGYIWTDDKDIKTQRCLFYLIKYSCHSVSHEPEPEPEHDDPPLIFLSSSWPLSPCASSHALVLYFFVSPSELLWPTSSFPAEANKTFNLKPFNVPGWLARRWEENWKYFFVQRLRLVLAAEFLPVLFSGFALIVIIIVLIFITAGAPFFNAAL